MFGHVAEFGSGFFVRDDFGVGDAAAASARLARNAINWCAAGAVCGKFAGCVDPRNFFSAAADCADYCFDARRAWNGFRRAQARGAPGGFAVLCAGLF